MSRPRLLYRLLYVPRRSIVRGLAPASRAGQAIARVLGLLLLAGILLLGLGAIIAACSP